jgi:hypothetical protein
MAVVQTNIENEQKLSLPRRIASKFSIFLLRINIDQYSDIDSRYKLFSTQV